MLESKKHALVVLLKIKEVTVGWTCSLMGWQERCKEL